MNKKYLSLPVVSVLFILTLLNSCGKSSSGGGGVVTPPTSGTADISIGSMVYSPASKTVSKGTVVKWTNNDGTAHTVTSNDGTSFSSGSIGSTGTYSYTTVTAGTFNYHCTIHGVTMAGTLIVTP